MNLETFWAYVEKRPDGHWIWTAGKTKDGGYGQFRLKNKTAYAHRFSYELAKGTVPAGLMVVHTCEHHDCVNPDHLVAGTAARDRKNERRVKELEEALRRCTYFMRLGCPRPDLPDANDLKPLWRAAIEKGEKLLEKPRPTA